MNTKSKKEVEEINRKVYGNKKFAELKRIGKKRGLLNVDRYKKTDRNILIERLVKGKQLKDENKNLLLKQAIHAGLKVNVSMNKETIKEKLTNPKLTDYTKDKLVEISGKRGIPLPSQISSKQIIKRLENPDKYYTVISLKKLLQDNNVNIRGIKNKQTLINLANENNLIPKSIKPEEIQAETNLWVSVKNIPEELRRVINNKPRTPREKIENFKYYLKNLNNINITPSRLKKLAEQLNKKIKKAEKQEVYLFTPIKEKSAFNNYVTQYVIYGDPNYTPFEFMDIAEPYMINVMDKNRNTKVKLYLYCKMVRMDPDFKEVIRSFAFHSIGQKIITESTDLIEAYHEMKDEIETAIKEMENKEGSGWVFLEVENLTLYVDIWDPLKASSYIDLPKELKNKKAIINMKNEDNKCFLWSVLRALNPTNSHPERIDGDLKSKEDTLNMEGIAYPVDFKGIKRFEKQNLDISISVLGYNEKEKVYSLYVSDYMKVTKKEDERKHNIILLLIKDEDGEKSHYCYVKNESALLTTQKNKRKCKLYYCLNCLSAYDNEKKLYEHKEYCGEKDNIKINMPPEGTYLKFKNFLHGEKAPFVIYADFECYNKPIHTTTPDPTKSYTNKIAKQDPASFVYYIISFNEDVYKSVKREYVKEEDEDPDVIDVFINWLEEDAKQIANLGNEPMKITPEEQKQFNQASDCWICGKKLNIQDRVRDHCHFTGRYRGAAHNRCNLKYNKPNNISVFFHNLSGYDSHLFIKKLGVTAGKIDCIPSNEEKYISFSKTIKTGEYKNKKGETKDKKFKIVFKDSMKFLLSSIEELVKILPKEAFKNLEKYFTPEEVELLKQKGFFPYDFLDDKEKLKIKKPPKKRAFYSKLSGKRISNKNYHHVLNVWKTCKMKTFKDYLMNYNTVDVLLLADIFEYFRDLCLKNYGLDPVYYYTAPGLAWDAMLKMTGVELELLSDVDMLLLFEKGIRGGVSMISNRYGEANNKYMKNYDKTKLSKFLMDLDANNLYGWGMSQKLPLNNFKEMTNEELENLFNNQIVQVWEKTPCILEVDLEYPEELHDLHNDYPLCPERVECEHGVKKLIPNLRDKYKYVTHYKNLMLYLSLGMKLKKIHQGIKFNESEWLKPYIDLNTNLRAKAKSNFEKDFFKLMNNSVFGKTMENIRNRVNIKLVNTGEEFKKLSAKPNYESRKIFNENLVSVHMKNTSLTMNKPVYVGMCILDLSKCLMYDFHYNYIKKKYGDRAKLLFTDTDSLLYEIITEDFYKDISEDVKNKFDTSNYPENHPSGIPTGINNKVVGMFKDELAGLNMVEFVGLRAKLYSCKSEDGTEKKKCKGIKKAVVANNILHANYKTCLLTGKVQYRTQNILRSYEHEIYMEEINKIALSTTDDKRYLLKDSHNTLAWGHYRLKDLVN